VPFKQNEARNEQGPVVNGVFIGVEQDFGREQQFKSGFSWLEGSNLLRQSRFLVPQLLNE
jgi:hypothetical protein